MLEESNIICLDEATANVDNDIEDWVLHIYIKLDALKFGNFMSFIKENHYYNISPIGVLKKL